MITEQAYKQEAKKLRVEAAAIKAVAQVEAPRGGFIKENLPVILYEPHVMWKELKKRGIDPMKYATKEMTVCVNGRWIDIPVDNPTDPLLYPIWVSGKYGPSSKQHNRLMRAAKWNREAALSSCSWGKFQIMGYNYGLAGFKTLQEFINAMYESEDRHLEAFVNYIKSTGLDDEIRAKDWKGFARGYNGPLYYRHGYDKKMERAYNALK